MRTLRLVAALLSPALLLACGTGTGTGDGDGDGAASDPGPATSAPSSPVPAATGRVSTPQLALVMDTGRPELCLGPVAQSWPPQCRGLPLAGWRWSEHPEHEEQDGARWGSFAVTGTWDGERFTVQEAVPAARYDVPGAEPTATSTPGSTVRPSLSPDELAVVAEESALLPGWRSAAVVDSQVLVDVVYDDGSLQEWADQRWGRGVVVLLPLLSGDRAP
ncbi:hypothetical protein [Nocardioides houyundeii]|uniref:hypothetical protein n=1 Tax=Nocardioides houyundeii TaxID=2045452 RepID=UPI000DF1BCF5|nr:hypothetical protein [Nocardioides houyundeii]